ncbi:MAG: AAA family ATPase, partial [Anaerolineae bacterium]|nr:AAA family ATPase [Anaerolineae bacterium]
IYVLRANTVSQMESFLSDLFVMEVNDEDPFEQAIRETKDAIMRVRAGAEFVDLSPQVSYIRRRQHEMVHKASLESESYGEEPVRHVRVLPPAS